MLDVGTQVVAGITPGKAGRRVCGVPVFDSCEQVVAQTGADTAVIFVPARVAADAVLEAVDAGIGLVVCITEGIPVQDMMTVAAQLERVGSALLGPNCPGLISPQLSSVGIMPAHLFSRGSVGVISRSGTLTYQVVAALTRAGIGQSTCVGIGGDPVHGLDFVGCLDRFEADPETEAVVLIGEIGGDEEERAAAHIAQHISKPVVAYLAGFSAPAGKTMGHAGAIIAGGTGTAAAKAAVLEKCGVAVAASPAEVATLLMERQRI
jgi:succinyl-CoA synthetase alpha subunit